MITILNRKEICVTFDMERQAEVRRILSANGIDYTVKTVNSKSPSPFAAGSRARTGTFGENLSLECEYQIFVHKDDYEEALHLIRR